MLSHGFGNLLRYVEEGECSIDSDIDPALPSSEPPVAEDAEHAAVDGHAAAPGGRARPRGLPLCGRHRGRGSDTGRAAAPVVARGLESGRAARERGEERPVRRRPRLRGGLRDVRPRRAARGPEGADDDEPGLVAGGLRDVRGPHDPHGLAQRRHLPNLGRPRRRRERSAPLRAAQLVARQRQPRQGAAPTS